MSKRSYFALTVPMVFSVLLAGGCAAAGTSAQSPGTFTPQTAPQFDVLTPDEAAGAAYCKQTGGLVEVRRPIYGTNNSSAKGELVLSGHAVFCQYTAKDTSRIHILATTLDATMPTLAALAYYAKVPLSSCPGGENPASCYCTQLGGSDQFGGATLAGGAWVVKGNAVDKNLEACMFPDMSSIDSWGLAYHSNGAIRGINLASVLRYKDPYHKH